MARPTALTPDVESTLVEALRSGEYLENAAALAGIAKSTVYEWLRAGVRDPEGPYGAFSDAIKRAQAEADRDDLGIIKRAGEQGNWQACAWRLERRHPQLYSARVQESARQAHLEILDAAKQALDATNYDRLLDAIAGKLGAA